MLEKTVSKGAIFFQDALEKRDNSEPINPLKYYVEHHCLAKKPIACTSNFKTSLQVLLLLVGAAYGIPWLEASSKAVVFFPWSGWHEILSVLFKFGIILTVGADGMWIMLQATKKLFYKSEKSFSRKNRRGMENILYVGLPLFLAFFVAIAPVYASIKYNAGLAQILSVITFLCLYGYGFYGYVVLMEKYKQPKKLLLAKKETLDSVSEDIKRRFLNGLSHLKRNPEILLSINTTYTFFQTVLSVESKKENHVYSGKKQVNKKILIGIALFIAISATIVGIFLVTEFIEKHLIQNHSIAFILSIIAETPFFIITFMSSYGALRQIFHRFLLSDREKSIFDQYYPKLSQAVKLPIFLISLLAPTAATYITYTTLTNGNAQFYLIWVAIFSTIAARSLFAHYTLSLLVAELTLFLGKKGNSKRSILLNRVAGIDILIKEVVNIESNHLKAMLMECCASKGES